MNQIQYGDEMFKHCRSESQPGSPPAASSAGGGGAAGGGSGGGAAEALYVVWIVAWILVCLWLFS